MTESIKKEGYRCMNYDKGRLLILSVTRNKRKGEVIGCKIKV